MFVGKKITVKEENFLASEKFTSFPTMVDDTNAAVTTDELGHKIISAGTIWPSNDSKAKGIIYHEMNVNEGPQMAALLVDGWFIGKNLPVAPTAEAMAAMTAVHFKDKDALTATTTDSGTTSRG
ncbi:hypothetical protein [Lactobacillus brevis] [Lactiplantibacillus mudanjiangensis]|uniref:hypothetical protein n=1 Tax=Lactiplantibacillus mudanjiangensis TaxID=1296538 RepID=UPI001014D5E1|nr:hypothetical protein [Lactobacillus brevis] [Lactiplantibacillus mudanjiangensis]